MNHPDCERWMEYLYGELTPGPRAELEAHLATCPECRAHLEAWRATMRGLDRWVLPKAARGFGSIGPLVKWGVAAVLVLGLGFGLGRLSAGPDLGQVRAELLPGLRQQLQQEWAADWQAALAANPTGLTNEFRRQLRGEFQQLAANAQGRRWLTNFVRSYQATRAEDHQAMLALFQEVDQRRLADYARLRKDLETVAVVAEGRLDRAQQEIGQLAAYRQNEPRRSDASELPKENER
ncbi:MAG: zf-HC2 domain-containing protein [Verrucomicrobia bacterium]|nr:zf-HC2 domain-containing protein [Verrucomicrobiota bacterium]